MIILTIIFILILLFIVILNYKHHKEIEKLKNDNKQLKDYFESNYEEYFGNKR